MIRKIIYQKLYAMINDVSVEHSSSLNQYAKLLIKGIQETTDMELSQTFIKNFPIIVAIHDIGKKDIPSYILNKTDKLTEDEYQIIQSHCQKGYEQIQLTFQGISLNREEEELINLCKESCLFHHERLDGSGYPLGLKKVPLVAQMVGIIDSFDAMTTDRCYKKAMSQENALNMLVKSDKYNEEIIYVLMEVLKNENEIRNSDE